MPIHFDDPKAILAAEKDRLLWARRREAQRAGRDLAQERRRNKAHTSLMKWRDYKAAENAGLGETWLRRNPGPFERDVRKLLAWNKAVKQWQRKVDTNG